jgi:4'-phosphopantetheinyl transferase
MSIKVADLATDVHLWRVHLNVTPAEQDRLVAVLARDEQDRANRYVFAEHRRRFVACRGALRQILATYSGLQPKALIFRYGPRGKPSLQPTAGPPLEFNTSHAEDLALIAITQVGSIGVDVEKIRPLTAELSSLAAQHFTPSEREALAGLTAEQQLTAFFRGWTRKEALIKADGQGLAHPLDQVEVGLGNHTSSDPAHFPPGASPPYSWKLHSLELPQGYVGALAAPAADGCIRYFEWP